jgi:ribosomal protein L40E
MITCRKCGAENASGAKFCQMCADPIAAGDSADRNSLSTTVVFSLEPSETQVCPICDAANEGGWAFCQQCGSKLGESESDAAFHADEHPLPHEQAFATTIRSTRDLDDPKKASGPAGVTCPKCSQRLVAGAAFCHNCGSGIGDPRTVAMSSIKTAPKAHLLLMVDGEATGDEFEVRDETVIGRMNGDITFPHDDYMSGRHAQIARRGDKYFLIDQSSRNGSFIRIKKEVEIKSGDFILLGKQLFRFKA